MGKNEQRVVSHDKRKKIAKDILPYLLIAPTLLLIFVILFFPVFKVFSLSLQDFSFTRPESMGKPVFFENFYTIFFGDLVFPSALFITLKWVFYEVGLQLVFGLIVALLMNQTFKGRGLARSMVFIPWAVSGVLTTMLWSLMYNQHVGLINDILIRMGLIKEGVAWLANPNSVFNSVILAELWRGIPFFAVTILAALQGIPREVYESSDIDGCGGFRRLIYIILPYLKQTIVFSTLLRVIWEFNSIDMIFTMTNGGPMRLTTTLPIYMMQTAIIGGDYGYGSALAVMVFIILILFSLFYLKISNYGGEIDE